MGLFISFLLRKSKCLYIEEFLKIYRPNDIVFSPSRYASWDVSFYCAAEEDHCENAGEELFITRVLNISSLPTERRELKDIEVNNFLLIDEISSAASWRGPKALVTKRSDYPCILFCLFYVMYPSIYFFMIYAWLMSSWWNMGFYSPKSTEKREIFLLKHARDSAESHVHFPPPRTYNR